MLQDPLLNNQMLYIKLFSGSQRSKHYSLLQLDASGNFYIRDVLATNNSDCSSTIKEVSVTVKVSPNLGELTNNGEGTEFVPRRRNL